mgnify:CR=1 FL=1
MSDFQCTWWPDTWFGFSLTECCIQHDYSGDHVELMACVASIHWSLIPLSVVMLLGLVFLKPIFYTPFRKR